MNTPIIIIYNPFDKAESELSFREAIASSFISKKVRDNAYLIVNDKDLKEKEVHDLIKSKVDISVNMLIIRLSHFYGTFYNEGIKWMEETFPNINFID